MRQPRQATSLRLPAEAPRQALAADEALLDRALAGGERPLRVRWWYAATPAVVVGLGLRQRVAEVVDLGRCARAGVEVLTRRAGGGALLLDADMLCGAICVPLPDPRAPDDLTESYRWLGDRLVAACHAVGVAGARRVEVDEARADVAALRDRADPGADRAGGSDPVGKLLLNVCYGALSPHEVAIGSAKLIGIAQVRRRHAALLQFGILLRDQSRLADLLNVPDARTRERLRAEVRRRTTGLGAATVTGRSAAAVAAAIADATPFAP
jgi:lipoate-protein ligase A